MNLRCKPLQLETYKNTKYFINIKRLSNNTRVPGRSNWYLHLWINTNACRGLMVCWACVLQVSVIVLLLAFFSLHVDCKIFERIFSPRNDYKFPGGSTSLNSLMSPFQFKWGKHAITKQQKVVSEDPDASLPKMLWPKKCSSSSNSSSGNSSSSNSNSNTNRNNSKNNENNTSPRWLSWSRPLNEIHVHVGHWNGLLEWQIHSICG